MKKPLNTLSQNQASFEVKLDYAIRKGAALAKLEHKRAGVSIFISENNKIVEIKPEQIQIPAEFKYLEEN